MSGLYADDDRLSLRVELASPALCLEAIAGLNDLLRGIKPAHPENYARRRPFIERLLNPLGRFSPASVASEIPYRPKPENGDRVYYVQSLPGKTKLLRAKLTAEEVNVLLNQIRGMVLSSGLAGDHHEIRYDYKSVRFNKPAADEKPEEISNIVQIVSDRFRDLQSEVLESDLLGLRNTASTNSRMIAVGSGATERQAVIAPRFSDENFVRWEDVRDEVSEALWKIETLSNEVLRRVESRPRWAEGLLDAEGGLSLRFFKIGRSAESSQDFVDYLMGLDGSVSESEIVSMAEQLYRLYTLVDQFIPGTQYESEDLEIIDDSHSPKDRANPEATKSVLTADVKAAGARLSQETWRSLYKALRASSDESEISPESIVEQIDIGPALEYLRNSIEEAIRRIRQSESDNLIEYWITGDEVLFYLRSESRTSQNEWDRDLSFRLTEVRLDGSEKLSLFEQALMREVAESAKKILEQDLSRLDVKMVQFQWTEEGPKLKLILHRPAFALDELTIPDAIQAKLMRLYPTISVLENLQVELLPRSQ